MVIIRAERVKNILDYLARPKIPALVAIPLMLLLVSGCNSYSNLGDNVLAKVDGEIITVDDYKAMNPDVPKEYSARERTLTTMINNVLISRKAHSEEMYSDPSVLGQLEEFNARLLPDMLRKDIAQQVVVTDEELAGEFGKPVPALEVSILTTNTLPEAQSAQAELAKGVAFEKVLAKYGIFKADVQKEIKLDDPLYPAGVKAVINGLQPGAVSPIVKLEIGYSIFRLNSKKSSAQIWDAAKEQKRAELKERKTNEAMDALTKKLWAEADIKTNEKLFQPNSDKSWGAKVDGVTITLDPGMIGDGSDPHAPHQSMKPQSIMSSINKMVARFLQAKEARRRGLQKDPEYQRRLKFKSEEILANAYVAKTRGDYEVTDADILAYYNKNKDKMSTKKAYRLSRILLNNETDTRKALGQIKSGKDFAAVAREMSADDISKINGGDIGIIVPEELKEPLKSAIGRLRVGEVTEPLKSGYGFEILKATDMKEAGMTPLADVKETIKKRVLLIKQSERVEKLYNDLSKKADIKINKSLLRSM